nr:putative reverse transcriptase domain-containing protein [Tanacetum cinerariifolium]
MKLKERIKSLSGNMKEEKIKQELEEIETINIKLHHMVTKLIAENKHLKKTYKKLLESIKSSRIRSKEQCDDLIKQVNIKSAKIFDLNASLQDKVLVITALKDTLRKLKGKVVVDEVVILHPIDTELLKINVALLVPKLQNNRTAHYDCLKHTQEETATLREIVKHERLLNPLNTSLDYVWLAGYYQRFIEGFSLITKPLTKLTQKNKTYEWGEEEEESFQLLKDKLCSAPILALPEGSEDFVVYCDASLKCYGAVLMQRKKVIAYAS